eukprot:366183-Chlamydomonas_euryale.AAC.5
MAHEPARSMAAAAAPPGSRLGGDNDSAAVPPLVALMGVRSRVKVGSAVARMRQQYTPALANACAHVYMRVLTMRACSHAHVCAARVPARTWLEHGRHTCAHVPATFVLVLVLWYRDSDCAGPGVR